MLQSKYQSGYQTITRSITPSSRQGNRQGNKHRQTMQPNQIFMIDFSDNNHRYEKKRKLCPHFLMSKAQQRKKKFRNNAIFTSEGILHCSKLYTEKTTVFGNSKIEQNQKSRASLLGAKRQQLHSAYNFTRTMTPKKATTPHNLNVYPVFTLYPQSRTFISAQTERSKLKLAKWRTNSYNALIKRVKTEGNQRVAKQLVGWQTRDIDFEELLSNNL